MTDPAFPGAALTVGGSACVFQLVCVDERRKEGFEEGLTLKLKLQYFGHLMWRADSFEKTLMLGRIEGRRSRGRQRM